MKKSRIVRPAAGVESPPPRRLPLVRLAQAAMVHRDTSVSALCRELGITPVKGRLMGQPLMRPLDSRN